jgi:hypothetical protein
MSKPPYTTLGEFYTFRSSNYMINSVICTIEVRTLMDWNG